MKQSGKRATDLVEKAKSLRRNGKAQEFVELILGALSQKRITDSSLITHAAVLLRNSGDRKRSLALLEFAKNENPGNKEAAENYARMLRDAGDLRGALREFIAANRISESASTHNSIGVCYYELRQAKSAVDHYRRATDLDPMLADSWANMGNALKDLHKTHEAVSALEHSLTLKPDYAWAMSCLSHLKQRLTLQEEAVQLADQALGCDRSNAEMWLTSLMVRLPLAPRNEFEGENWLNSFQTRLEEIREWSKDTVNLRNLGERVGYSQPYYIAYRPGNHRDLLGRYGHIMSQAAQRMRGHAERPRSNSFQSGRKIRLGVVCGFIFRHSVWDIILKGIVLNLNRDDIEIFIFYTGSTQDEQTDLARANAEHFVQGPHPHLKWIELVREANLDAILYPEVGMDPYSMHLASLRLAPLQIASWGHPITSGLPTIDWFLSGETLEPNDGDEHYVEKLVRLPGTGVCTHRLEIKPKPIRLQSPDDTSLDEHVKYYVCQHAFKFNDEAIELLSDIISENERSLLVIVADNKYPEAFKIALEKLKAKLTAKIPEGDKRLYLLPWMSREQFLGSFAGVDVYLDLPGFSGYTTAWQAISQGIPIVTLQGRHLRQRLAAGVLRVVGEEEGIAESSEEYRAWCKKFADEYHGDRAKWIIRRNRLIKAYENLDGNVAPVRKFESLLQEYFSRTPVTGAETQTSTNEFKAEEAPPRPIGSSSTAASSILIAQQSDLSAALSSQELKHQRLIFFCPQLMDIALSGGHTNSVLIQPTVHRLTQQTSLSRIHSTATLIDLQCEEIRRTLFGDDYLTGWDAQLVSFFLARLEIIRNVGKSLQDVDVLRGNCHLLISKNPQIYYFDGSPTSRLLGSLIPSLRQIITYANRESPANPFDRVWNTDTLPTNDGDVAISHIPTCFHHKTLFESWLKDRYGASLRQLPSTHWDVSIEGVPQIGFLHISELEGSPHFQKSSVYASQASKIYKELLNRHFNFDVIDSSQERVFKQQLLAQAYTYLSLRNFSKVKSLTISDHDVGYHGPLHSAASQWGAKICVLPHSEVSDSMKFVPSSRDITIIQDINYRSYPKSVTGGLLNVIHAHIRKPVDDTLLKKANTRETICLLLNSLHTNLSCYTNIKLLSQYHKAVLQIAGGAGLNVVLRVKPSGAPINILARLLELDPKQILEDTKTSVQEIAKASRICISYGEPTSAITDFLASGCYIMSAWDQEMPCNHWDELSLRYHIVRPQTLNESINSLSRLIADPELFGDENRRQQKLFRLDIEANKLGRYVKEGNPLEAA